MANQDIEGSLSQLADRVEAIEQRLGMSQSAGVNFISDDARNGLITASGIVLAMAFAFFGPWLTDDDPTPWEPHEVVLFVLFGVSTVMMLVTLYRAMVPYRQSVPRYEHSTRIFFLAVVIMVGSVFTASFVNLVLRFASRL